MEVCTNYRYARRHDEKFAQVAVDEEAKDKIVADDGIKETPKVGAKKKILSKK